MLGRECKRRSVKELRLFCIRVMRASQHNVLKKKTNKYRKTVRIYKGNSQNEVE